MENALVSIIMPVYNAGPYLKECLASIFSQSYPNWELLAVDDFSTDTSYNTLLEFQSIDERIKVFRNTSKGIIDALQLGFKNASGALITRMDADDIMAPDKIEALMACLIGSPEYHIAVGKVQYFSDARLGKGYEMYAEWLNGLTENNSHWSEVYRECVIPSPSWMMRRKDFMHIGGFNSTTYPEDYDLCFRMYKHKMKIISTDRIIHHWRDHDRRASRNDPNYEDNRFLEMKLKYFLDIDLDKSKHLTLWGAGRKGKALAKILTESNIAFHWITNNPSKIGSDIYGHILQDDSLVEALENPQLVIAIAAPHEKLIIAQRLKKKVFTAGKEYFYFC